MAIHISVEEGRTGRLRPSGRPTARIARRLTPHGDASGGLGNLVRWVRSKRAVFGYSAAARLHAVALPQGLIASGVPGSGKSFAAEWAARSLAAGDTLAGTAPLPLLQLDMGDIMGRYPGESEARFKRALRLWRLWHPASSLSMGSTRASLAWGRAARITPRSTASSGICSYGCRTRGEMASPSLCSRRRAIWSGFPPSSCAWDASTRSSSSCPRRTSAAPSRRSTLQSTHACSPMWTGAPWPTGTRSRERSRGMRIAPG